MAPRLLAWALVIAGLAGCGAGRTPAPDGAALFRSQCTSCHTIAGNENRRTQGGDLLRFRIRRRQLLQFVGEMPTRMRLTPTQVAAVTDYVRGVQQSEPR